MNQIIGVIDITNILIFISLIIIIIQNYKANKQKPIVVEKPGDLNEADKAKQFLDKIIKDKFEYYLVTEILPIYKVGKQLDKNQVEELKEQFFIDVSLFLNKNSKNLLKKYFNTDAIKIYIIEKFYILLNKVDIAYFEENKVSEKEIKSLLS